MQAGMDEAQGSPVGLVPLNVVDWTASSQQMSLRSQSYEEGLPLQSDGVCSHYDIVIFIETSLGQ